MTPAKQRDAFDQAALRTARYYAALDPREFPAQVKVAILTFQRFGMVEEAARIERKAACSESQRLPAGEGCGQGAADSLQGDCGRRA
jgi:hypothetical protein